MSATELRVYTDENGHHRYDFTIDKDDMLAIKEYNTWTQKQKDFWESVKWLPDDHFFKKAFAFSIWLEMLYNMQLADQKTNEIEAKKHSSMGIGEFLPWPPWNLFGL